MADTLSNLEENSRPIFHSSPLTLLELASMKIALHIWVEKYRKYGKIVDESYLLDASHLRDELQLSTVLNVPQKIIDIIDSCLDLITIKLQPWYRYAKYGSLGNLPFDQIRKRLDFVVFGGNGTVHIRRTIANYLEDDSLSDEIKFEIACVNCVEEKVDFFWPLVKDSPRSEGKFNDCMVFYWINKKIKGSCGELQRRFGISDQMIEYCSLKRVRLALEYFLTLGDPNRPFNWFETIVSYFSEYSHHLPWYLLPFGDATSQRNMLDQYQVDIFYHFFQDLELTTYAVQLWPYVRDLLATIENFHDCVILYCIDYKMQGYLENRQKCMMGRVLAEIWFNSPLDWRHHVLNFHFSEILRELLKCQVTPSRNFGRDITFLLAMLSDANVDVRNRFFMENWSEWIADVPPAQFESLMRLCLVNTEIIDNFRRTLPSTTVFRNYCDTLMCQGHHRKMDQFVNGLCSNQDEAVNIKKCLLINEITVFSVRHDRYFREKHKQYIDRLFSNQALADDFKYRLILSDKVWQQLCDKIDANHFIDVRDIIDYFVTSSKREEVIRKLLEAFSNRLTNARLYPVCNSDWEKFLRWCFNCDKKQVEMYKASLPINHIFEIAFSKLVNGHLAAITLKSFFIWYFKSKPECKKFNRERIQHYEKMKKADVEKSFGKNKKSVINLMKAKLFI